MSYLACEGLSIGYGGTPVAEGITFSLDAGDAVLVVGENGSGKSTLVKTLLGLLPPLAGDVVFGEEGALFGMLASIMLGTPVGSTIVVLDALAYALFCLAGWLERRN